MKAKVEAIASHGINVFVNRQLVYNYPESILAEKGVMTIEHADFEGVERLSLVTGGEITSTFDRPELVKLGRCDLIEEIMIGEDKVEHCCDLPDIISQIGFLAHQILGCCGWRGMHCCVAWFYQPDGRRGRALLARRAFSAFANGEGDTCRAWWGMLRDADECGGRRKSEKGPRQEGDRSRGVCTCTAPDPNYTGRQRWVRFVRSGSKITGSTS